MLFGEDGVAEGLSTGKIVVDMSSISPIATKDFAKRINELGCDYLDAPVSGGEVGAKAATLTIMVGGDEAAFERVKPLFELMGKNITLVGGNGDGQTCKVANQIIVALTIEAVGEALLFASKAGADPAKVRQALMGGFASSRILEVHGERMIKRTFEPGLPDRAAPEGPEPGARRCAGAGAQPAEHRRPARSYSTRASARGGAGVGPRRPRPSARMARQPRDRPRRRSVTAGSESGDSPDTDDGGDPPIVERGHPQAPRNRRSPRRGASDADCSARNRFDRGQALEPQMAIEDLAEAGRIASMQGIDHLFVLSHGLTPSVTLQRVGGVSRGADAPAREE